MNTSVATNMATQSPSGNGGSAVSRPRAPRLGAAFQLGRRIEAGAAHREGWNGPALGRCTAVPLDPGSVAVAADVAARPVPDRARPLEQPVGQVREQEHGERGGQAEPWPHRITRAGRVVTTPPWSEPPVVTAGHAVAGSMSTPMRKARVTRR